MLPQLEFAYNATRALGIKHTSFEANFRLSPKEPPDLLFSMRPSIPVSQDATKRLKLLQEVHAPVRLALQLHKDDMQSRSKPPSAPRFVRGDNATIVTKHLFLRGQPNMNLYDRQLGPFLVEEQIGKRIYILKLPTAIRLHPMFHVNNLRPCSPASLRPFVPVEVPKGGDEEFEVSYISVVCVNILP
jgi:hypothetical protein